MRESDKLKEYRSYIVVKDSITQTLKVKGEFWTPGYTKAHQPTPERAIQFELDKVRDDKIALERRASELYKLRSDVEKNDG